MRTTNYYQKLIAIVLCCVASTAMAQQGDSRSTLADRLESLRTGWSNTSPAEQTAAVQAERQAVVKKAYQNQAALEGQLPRVNPRDLLPQGWKITAPATQTAKTAGPAAAPAVMSQAKTKSQATGSTRARLLRDVRGGNSVGVEERPPVPRAGSVLSSLDSQGPNSLREASPSHNEVTLEPTERNNTWATAALTRSIAAEVAESLGVASEEKTETESVSEEFAAAPVTIEEPAQLLETEASPLEGMPAVVAVEEVAVDEAVEEIVAELQVEQAPAITVEIEEQVTIAEPTPDAVITTEAQPLTKLPFAIGGEVTADPVDETTLTHNMEAAPSVSKQDDLSQDNSDQLLLTQKMPVIVYQVAGPRKMVVGREATYRVTLDNRGDAPADNLDAKITVPGWAEVVGTQADTGNVDKLIISEQPREILWKISSLKGSQKAVLNLRLIARAGRPIELGVQWTHSPVRSQTIVEVQEPKLAMNLTGPEEVFYGKPQLFRLSISNPGTGTAEEVMLHLTPPGGDATRSVNHSFGTLAAGESRTVEIELTAREAGQLMVNASATATGDLTAEANKEIFCRKPELAVDWRGPKERFAGAPATYFLRVRNPGTAAAPGVVLSAQLPEGFELISSDNAKVSDTGMATFQVGSLRPGDDRYYELKGLHSLAGPNVIAIQAKASDQTISESVEALTQVTALADLKLDVLDPKGPVATGEEIEYQIRVTNRGSCAAEEVNISALFSEGIEPSHVVGAPSTINDGRVTFDQIATIPAGEVRVFTIRATADQAGTHLFRAEVFCRDLEIKLAAEETTRFFKDETIDIATQPGSRYDY